MSADQRMDRAREYSASHQVPVDRLQPSEMQCEIRDLRSHLRQLLAVIGELGCVGLDSESGQP